MLLVKRIRIDNNNCNNNNYNNNNKNRINNIIIMKIKSYLNETQIYHESHRFAKIK